MREVGWVFVLDVGQSVYFDLRTLPQVTEPYYGFEEESDRKFRK